MRAVRSAGVAFAGAEIVAGIGRSEDVRGVTEGESGGGRWSKDPRLRVKCFGKLGTKFVRSGVETMVWAVEMSKQCFKVSSGGCQ